MNLLRVLAVLEAGVNSTQASWFFYDNEFMEKIVSFVRSHFIQNFEFSDFFVAAWQRSDLTFALSFKYLIPSNLSS